MVCRHPSDQPLTRSKGNTNEAQQVSGENSPSSNTSPSSPSPTQKPLHRTDKPSPSVVIPCLILGSINAYNLWSEHWEHWEHMPPLEERIEYPYQNIRTKNFFWGDGDKTLFWNDKVNYHNKDKTT